MITQLDKRRQAGGLFCDLTKAFDCINHGILLNKLHYYRIRGFCYAWFESYLVNRKQKVCLLSNSSEDVLFCNWERIFSGVPQGSILGPMLFIIYLNDLPYSLDHEGKLVLYVDDTSVLITAKNDAELKNKVKPVLASMIEWFSANGLALNMDKTNIMKFTPSNRLNTEFEIMHHKLLKESSHTKFLGLELDKNINLKNHIKKILMRLSSACYLIRRMSPF
jgi:hypothetical protein